MPMPRERFAASENAARYKKHSVVFLRAVPFTGPPGNSCCKGTGVLSRKSRRCGWHQNGGAARWTPCPLQQSRTRQEAERTFVRGAPAQPHAGQLFRANHGTRGAEIRPVCLDLGPRAWWRGWEGGETALPRSKGIG